eukprot:gene24729-biopygen14969
MIARAKPTVCEARSLVRERAWVWSEFYLIYPSLPRSSTVRGFSARSSVWDYRHGVWEWAQGPGYLWSITVEFI